MKYIDEFRNAALVRQLAGEIARHSTRPVQLMEFCGGHTHAIAKFGLRQLLPPTVRLRSGPGCPVCVTSASDLEQAIALAQAPGVILATFGDMVRVPGHQSSLQDARARGADVRVVYSPLDALDVARQNPDQAVIFLGVGFETTAPAVAATVLQAESESIANFYIMSLHKFTPPATRAILSGKLADGKLAGAGETRLDGIIGPGHVTAIIGADAWQFLPEQYGVPCAVAGFEPVDILRAIAILVKMVEAGQPAVGNAYERGVKAQGNRTALAIMDRVFEPVAAEWRGLGMISDSGLALRKEFAHRDAVQVFARDLCKDQISVREPAGCRCGDVLRGSIEPPDCPLFRGVCSPHTPVGPCMVSSEGACAAYYQYGAAE